MKLRLVVLALVAGLESGGSDGGFVEASISRYSNYKEAVDSMVASHADRQGRGTLANRTTDVSLLPHSTCSKWT